MCVLYVRAQLLAFELNAGRNAASVEYLDISDNPIQAEGARKLVKGLARVKTLVCGPQGTPLTVLESEPEFSKAQVRVWNVIKYGDFRDQDLGPAETILIVEWWLKRSGEIPHMLLDRMIVVLIKYRTLRM